MSRRSFVAIIAALVASVGAGHVAGSTISAFSSTTALTGTLSTKAVFAATRSWNAWDLRDASSGAETNVSDAEAFTGVTTTTSNWATTWSTARYLTFDMNAPLPATIAASGVTFNFDFADADNGPTTQTCFWFEVIRRSTSAVIGTHGSTASPVACQATTTVNATSTPLPEVTSSDIANDLRIKVYGMRTNAAGAMLVDRAVVSGSTSVDPFTLYETTYTDAANGSPVTTPWSIAAADATSYLSANNWPTAFSTTRYLKVTFPDYLPASATVTSAQLVHTYRPNTAAQTVCYYFDVLQGATVLATYGSAAVPFCATGATYTTNTIPTPALNTAARVNGAIIKMYVRTSAAGRSLHDLFQLDVGYSVD
jgi:hypothetical protein